MKEKYNKFYFSGRVRERERDMLFSSSSLTINQPSMTKYRTQNLGITVNNVKSHKFSEQPLVETYTFFGLEMVLFFSSGDNFPKNTNAFAYH